MPGSQSYETAWLSRILVEETLRAIGFGEVSTGPAKSFFDQKAKREMDMDKTSSADQLEKMGIVGPYDYSIVAVK